MKRRILSIFSFILALVMVLPMVAPMTVMAAGSILATVNPGEIFEVRNLTNQRQSVTLSGADAAVFDILKYDGGGAVRTETFISGIQGRGLTFAGGNMDAGGGIGGSFAYTRASLETQEMFPGGKMVIEVRGSTPVTISGDPADFQVRQLITPVFYVQELHRNSSISFINHLTQGHNNTIWGQALGAPHFSRGDIPRGTMIGTFSPCVFTVVVERTSPSGQVSSHEVFHATGSRTIGIINPGYTVVFSNQTTNVLPSWAIPSLELYADHTVFSGQPYRLTIDGQRSFPPGMEQDLPQITTPQIPTPDFSDPGEWGFTPIDELDALILAEITEETLAMITRSGHIRPFSEFNRAYHVSRGGLENPLFAGERRQESELRGAYYEVIVGMIFNDSNLALRHVEDRSSIELWPVANKPYKIVSSFLSRNNVDERHLDPDQIAFLMAMHEHAHRVDRIMQEAIVMILRDFSSEAELRQHQTAIDFLLTDTDLKLYLTEKLSIELLVLNGILSKAQYYSLAAIGVLASYASWDRSFSGNARVSVEALENVREVIWRKWDAEITEGNRHGFTTDRLLTLHNLFNISRYLVVEQHSWSAIVMDGDFLNIIDPVEIVRRLGGDSRWARDVWLQDDLNYIRLIQSPTNYPLFTQFNRVARELQAPQNIIRLYNDGGFVLRNGWGTSNSTIERGTFRISDDGNSITLNGTDRNRQFQIRPGAPDSGISQLLISGNDTYRLIPHGIPAEMIQWIITLQ